MRRLVTGLVLALGAAGCAAATQVDGGEGESLRSGAAEADVRFMQHMLVHHAQALEMTALVAPRSEWRGLHLLAERIEVSQQDEIAMMERWLRERKEDVPNWRGQHAGHGGGNGDHAHMPGMLTPEQLERLAAAQGADFDRLFLEYMIQHHQGALVMVAELFAAPGAAQEAETFQIASEIDADQRVEIERMRRLRGAMPAGAERR